VTQGVPNMASHLEASSDPRPLSSLNPPFLTATSEQVHPLTGGGTVAQMKTKYSSTKSAYASSKG